MSMRSFGEWMLLSGSAKPVTIVGMPLSCSAGTIGSVPPERVRIGLIPNAFSNASRAILIAGESAATRPGRVEPGSSSTSTVGSVRRGLVQQALDLRRDRLRASAPARGGRRRWPAPR